VVSILRNSISLFLMHFTKWLPWVFGPLLESNAAVSLSREKAREDASILRRERASRWISPTICWHVMLTHSHRQILHPNCLLAAIKILHTAVWAVMAGSILALPVAAFTRHFRWALILTALIVCECAVLAANRGRCPLTDWAARFSEDRAANFDIYLPDWLARNNKVIFGTLFALNELVVLWRWLGQR
jgi:hypothetical protein